MVSPAIVAAIITIVFTALAILIGLAYRNLRRRVRRLEEETDTRQGKHTGLVHKVDTLWRYVFGREDDETDGGIAKDIEFGFERIEEDINGVRENQEKYHEQEMEQMRKLVNELHDDENVDVEREDIFE